jgi:hypothetical protein
VNIPKDEIEDWKRDRVTRLFMAVLAAEALANRENAVTTLGAFGDPARAAGSAHWCEALRWAMSEAVETMAEIAVGRMSADEGLQNGEKVPEEVHALRRKDALPEGD